MGILEEVRTATVHQAAANLTEKSMKVPARFSGRGLFLCRDGLASHADWCIVVWQSDFSAKGARFMAVMRPAIMGRNGVVASAHPAASLAGLNALMNGGNAVDAAIAVAATLNVVEPYMSGLGGDGVMLITTPGASQPVVLDFLGVAPANASPESMTRDDTMYGPRAPLVPGAPKGWFAALERFGTKSAGELFSHAIDLAENGSPVSHKSAEFINNNLFRVEPWDVARETFSLNGAGPQAYSLVRQPRLARTLRTLAERGPNEFYAGSIGEEMCRSIQAASGFLTMEDLASLKANWLEPVSTTAFGLEIFGAPPPTCTFESFQLLRILEREDLLELGHNSVDYLHFLVEAIKLAAADRISYTMKPDFDHASTLTPEYIASQHSRIDWQTAARGMGERFGDVSPDTVKPGRPSRSNGEHTTHFAVADADGMAVNVTQSIGSVLGSGFMAGETGILMNNFLDWTDLDASSPNHLQPGKPMENCMAPVHIYVDGAFCSTIGTPGSWGILQTTPQMIVNAFVHGMNIQEAIEQPRIRFMGNKRVVAEERIPAVVLDELERRGHDIARSGALTYSVGGGHATLRDSATGVLSAGADPRRDGYAMGW
jgi:gamma-glutamyltranspeptidase / glutathione hydrolase